MGLHFLIVNNINIILPIAIYFKVQYETERHKAVFTVKVRHGVLPKLYDPGPKGGKLQLVLYVEKKKTS